MFESKSRIPPAISLVASALGLSFATSSTLDYAAHLDRGLHDLHCSFVPGAGPTEAAEACRTAMYSPYAAFFRDKYWGGIPISLFALGSFTFFAGFALYLLLAGARAPRRAVGFFTVVAITPLLASAVMGTISAVELGSFCKTCVGIYISSFLLALGALLGALGLRRADGDERPRGSWLVPAAFLPALGAVSLVPAAVYASSMPDHRPYLDKCGTLKKEAEAGDALAKITGKRPVKKATFFEDPLCPTCRAFHQRLRAEGVLDRLDVQLALFPLDSECNWMLSSAMHPGACTVSKAVICGKDRTQQLLEWAYDEQEALAKAGKLGTPTLRAVIEKRWGADLVTCIDSTETKQTLNKHLHFAAENAIAVSTPQVFLGKQRVCDEDTDMGLRFTLRHLSPELLP
ncbi:MAG: hypothetical protein HYZ29_02490 [Myxococcales bacterium]|nr:hypothetical protein [Myxococcales bacterium]